MRKITKNLGVNIIAAGKKTIIALRRSIPDMKMILDALFLSHIDYSPTINQSINQNLKLKLERQLNWAVKISFFKKNNFLEIWSKSMKFYLCTIF